MAAYVIVDLEIVNPNGFQQYRERVVDAVKKYGGKYIAVSDVIETLEGTWNLCASLLLSLNPCGAQKIGFARRDTERSRQFGIAPAEQI
jgi:uncharacterized protein (DUF1330 family)